MKFDVVPLESLAGLDTGKPSGAAGAEKTSETMYEFLPSAESILQEHQPMGMEKPRSRTSMRIPTAGKITGQLYRFGNNAGRSVFFLLL